MTHDSVHNEKILSFVEGEVAKEEGRYGERER